jgi:hypothetical protein
MRNPEELERWDVYLNRCVAVQRWRLSQIPEVGARMAAIRRFFWRVARTGQLPLKQILTEAQASLDEENLKRFLFRLTAEMKSKNWGKRWIYDEIDRAILQLWDGFDIISAKGLSSGKARLRALPPLSRWNATAASECISFILSYANVGISSKAYAMRLHRLGLKPEKPAYVFDAKFQRSPHRLTVNFSPAGEPWWRNQKRFKKCGMTS